ncbi:MAG: putative Ig domain-containing protein, partial [Desulfobacula sp.]|uniref:putative Ig domain-containing protein n=1 Tax=Desulfobacula sp. TaxID=2593537 RepID=UPI0025BBCC03
MNLKRQFHPFYLKVPAYTAVILTMLLFQLIQPRIPGYQEVVSFFGPAIAAAAQPVADAGVDQAATKDLTLAGTILLDGSGSNDPDGDSLVYFWYGPFETTHGLTPAVVVPEGSYNVSLIVNDGSSRSEIDTAHITISPCFNISTRSKAGKVQLTWTHREGTQNYLVYRADESDPFNFELIAETTSTYSTYLDTTISNETTYLYLIKAVSECTGDLDNDGDVDGSDLSIFSSDIGRTDCDQGEPCEGDFNGVGNIDSADISLFSHYFGKYNCTSCYSNVVAGHPTASRPPANAAPVIYSPPVLHGTTGIPYNYDINASDPNGDDITYSLSTSPFGMSINAATGLISWSPDTAGTYEVTADITDGNGGNDTQSFVITIEDLPVLNQGPTITSTPVVSAVEGQLYIYDVDATDPDPDDVLVYSLENPPNGMQIDTSTGLIQWTPGETQIDDHMISIHVDDRAGLFDTQNFILTVSDAMPENIPPVAEAGPEQIQTLIYGQTEIIIALNGSGSSDPDGTVAGYTWTSEPGVPDPENIAEPSVTLTAGTYLFTLIVTDNAGAASIADTVTIIINAAPPVGEPPVISIDPLSYTVAEGALLSIDVSATDPDGDVVTLSASPKLNNAQFLSIPGTQATGTFDFTPDNTQQGIYVIAFKARDPLGLTATKTVRITVINVNRPPEISAPDPLTIDEGGLLTILIQASDPDDDILTLTATPLPNNAIFIPATGTITFTPDFDQAGTYSIDCQAHDGELSANRTVEVIVNDVSGSTQQDLVLEVHPVETPTFLDSTRITGTVNSSGTAPPRLTSALISQMHPVTGKQGETLDVILTGEASGNFETHFTENVSQADFGNDITINALTINSPTEAVVNISIAPDAQEGPRSVSVVTDKETAVSALAFNVAKGQASATGVLVDTDTGQAIAGAAVTIQGTNLTTITNADGVFVFNDAPSGSYKVIINAPNHELIILQIDTRTGDALNLGTIESSSTVFDPDEPPGATLPSVHSRGLTRLLFTGDLEEARQLIQDTIITVGGNSYGIVDAYGNQLNPN